MVSGLSIAFMIISMAVCFLLPVVLTIYFYRKQRISLIAVLVGALVFFVSQVLIRIPLLGILGRQQWYINMAQNVYIIALFLGLTAGIFEEVARYIAMKLLMKKNLSWKNGIAFGIGHGGIEAVAIVGLTMMNYIIMSLMINSGAFDAIIASKLPAEIAYQIKSTLINSPVVNFLAGGFERIMTMSVQIAFSVLVLYSVKFKKPLYLIFAILLHAVVDSPVVVLGTMGLNVWVIELYVVAWAVIGLVYTIKVKKSFDVEERMQEQELGSTL